MSFKIGDSVKMKKGIMDPDMQNLCIEGWQGRIFEITTDEDENTLIGIEWDSITLKNMPEHFIDKNEEEGLDYTKIYLYDVEIEPTEPRDTEKDVEKSLKEIAKAHSWNWLGEEGKRIREALAGVDKDNVMEAFRAWEKYLAKKLTFPFDARVSEYQEKGPLQSGDEVSVKKIAIIDDLYGIIVELRYGRKKYAFPLCDLEAVNEHSANYQPIKDYRVWFANR